MARQPTDYEKQYEEDLERAQALSLESLALEQFKNKKRLKDLNVHSFRNTSDFTRSTRSVSGKKLKVIFYFT